MFQGFGIFLVIQFVVIVAALVLFFWLAIAALRALNIYIRKNRPPRIDQQTQPPSQNVE